ncbi:hypothetical protein BBP40_003399 [Aspergillus hancockii]|nr:hypothetical protein BBP40_003399 [Aspergillus hancockii]
MNNTNHYENYFSTNRDAVQRTPSDGETTCPHGMLDVPPTEKEMYAFLHITGHDRGADLMTYQVMSENLVSNPGTQSSKGTAARIGNNYNKIQFVNDAPAPSTLTQNWEYAQETQDASRATTPAASAVQGPITELPVEQDSTDRAEIPRSSRLEHLLRVDGNVAHVSTLGSTSDSPLRHSRETVAKSRGLHDASSKYTRSHVLNASDAQNLIRATSGDEMGLLRYFRYYLASWIDAGDPECGFEVQALLLAKTERPLLAAILALALTHSLSQQDSSDMDLVAAFYDEAKRGLSRTADPIRSLGETFLMLRDFFSLRPTGIATSNDFLEQWDMVLIASLLTIAPEMTHASQQSILLKQLEKIATVTGIKLDCEIDALRSGWDVSQYDEEAFD